MRKIFGTILAATVALTLGACNADLRSNPADTNITFTIEAFHQTILDRVVPLINVTANIEGHVPLEIGREVPAMFRHTILSAMYPQAAEQVEVTAELVEPNPDVVLKCTWMAQTPAGRRYSRDSIGSEGESYAGAPVSCKYVA
jgi:hypothetical protein